MINEFDMEKFLLENFDVRISGTNLYFCCPFCKDDTGYNYWFNPSKVYIHRKTGKKMKGLGRCFKCEEHHNVLTFIMMYLKKDFISAIEFIKGDKKLKLNDLKKMLYELDRNENYQSLDESIEEFSQEVKVSLPKSSTNKLPEELIHWFTKTRSFPKELLKLLNVKYCLNCETEKKLMRFRNRAIFPVKTGNFSGWQAYLYVKSSKYPKTINPPGPIMRGLMYMYDVNKKSEIIMLNEGIFDSLRSFSRGFSAVALFGKTLSTTQSYMLSKTSAKEVCICLDGGEKERLATIKNACTLYEFFDGDITMMRIPDGIDPDDCKESVFIRCFNQRVLFSPNRVQNDLLGKMIGYNW